MDVGSIQNAVLESRYPALFYDCINHWSARKWTPESLAKRCELSDLFLHFRVGKRTQDAIGPPSAKKTQISSEVVWEKDSSYIQATLTQFSNFISGTSSGDTVACGEFDQLTPDSWVYADYKHMIELFRDCPQFLDEIDWGDVGFDNRTGRETTFWLGTAGAHTPCHFDSYGCNLVAQLYGRKKWILFPPSETCNLYPTRIPFEESSVFSRVNPSNADLNQYPLFSKAVKYEITLEPGQVLLVPKHWWHYVECVSTAISVNTWLDLDSDCADRVEEGVATVLTAALTNFFRMPSAQYYNPKETPVMPNEALDLLTNSIAESQNHEPLCYPKPSKLLCKCCDRRVKLLQPTNQPIGDHCTSNKNEPIRRNAHTGLVNVQTPIGRREMREADVVNAATHPNVLTILAAGLMTGTRFK